MEQRFALLYTIPGITDLGVDLMTLEERRWMLDRVAKQKRAEADAFSKRQRRKRGI